MLKDLYIVRHGHPKLGTGIAYDRVPGPPLSETGQEEARVAGLYLAHIAPQRLYSSPLERAYQTAEIIGKNIGHSPIVEESLAEHRKEETFDVVKSRLKDFLARLQREQIEDERVAVVSHGSPIKALLLLLSNEKIDLTQHVYPNGNHVPTAGIWHAQFNDQGCALELVFKPIVTAPVGHVAV